MSNASESYKRNVIHHNEHFEMVSCEWTSESVSPKHDHAWSQCLIVVESGRFENTLYLGLGEQVQHFEAGQVIATPLGAKHEIRCLSATGKTLHLYVPKINEDLMQPRFSLPSLSLLREGLDLSLVTEGRPWEAIVKCLEQIENSSVSTQSPYFMNQLFSGILPETLAAEAVVTRTKATMATFEASPALTAVEIEVVDGLGALMGWSAKAREGIAVPGGSAANFMALNCARQQKFPLMKSAGLDGRRLKVFVSADAHYSFKKACAALGIGTDNMVLVPVDRHGKMNTSALDTRLRDCGAAGDTPLLVCATAGTTVRGAFDPIEQMSKICKQHKVWLHVDAAWGGPVLFSAGSRRLMGGVDEADSVTFDAHKLLGAGLTCSFLLTRHAGLLLEANDVSGGDYLFHADEALNRGRMSWQCGRRADALSLWTLWKSHGTHGLGNFVDRQLVLRDSLLKWISDQPRLELVYEPEFLNICLRVQAPKTSGVDSGVWSRVVRDKLRDQNFAFVNYSSDEAGPFLRMILANPALELSHLVEILEFALKV